MIRHLVMWRLKGETTDEKRQAAATIKAALEGLNGRIPGLIRLEVGIDFSGTHESSDIVLYSELESQEALDAYQAHPEHQAVMPLIRSLRVERRVVDYEAPEV